MYWQTFFMAITDGGLVCCDWHTYINSIKKIKGQV